MNKNINIDGFKLNEIIGNDSYRKEVLKRLRYAQTILQETKYELIGTNFESLLKIIKESCEQLQDWINEYKLNKGVKNE